MAWVRFLSDFDFKPVARVTIAYRAGDVFNVTTVCARQAIAAGKAEVFDNGKFRKNPQPGKAAQKTEPLA